MKKKIFFAHANGFPSKVYLELFELLNSFEIKYVPILSHGKYKLKSSYQDVVPEIIDFLESSYSEPIWGVGHSSGAFLLAYAAKMKPELFKGLIMIDPVVLSFKHQFLMKIFQILHLIDYVHPLGKKSRKRSTTFPSKEIAYKKLRNKSIFKSFTEKTFKNYLKYGFEETKLGLKLKYNREIETKIYSKMPTLFKPINLKIPNYFLYATEGKISETRDIDSIKYLFPNTKFIPKNGGHLYPFENPEKMSLIIKKIIKEN